MNKIISNNLKVITATFFAVSILSGIFGFANVAGAIQCAPGGTLTPDQFNIALNTGQIQATISTNESNAVATITNNTACIAPVSFAAYKMFDEALSTQVIVDGGTLVNVPANSQQSLTVSHPDCSTQLDFYYGTAPRTLLDSNPYAYPNNPFVFKWAYYKQGEYCTNPQPLFCSPANQTVDIGNAANFSATGGTGTFSWSASNGSPTTGSGSNFSTNYGTSGNKTVTVTSGSQTATCNVAVNEPPQETLACNPADQSVYVNNPANFSATGGNGIYSWSTNVGGDSGNPASGTGANFTTAYGATGYKTVTVSSGSQTVACHVTVNEPPQNTLTCTPANQSVLVNGSASFSATGGNGTYSWSASDGSQTTGVGVNFSTTYSSVGARSVTVTSGAQTATCNVVVNTIPQQTLTCAPQTQSGYVWTYFNFSATGGTGTFSWFTNDGSPSIGSGANFSTQFFNTGIRTVLVSSGGQTATCNVTVNQQQQNNLTCGPQNQTANINDNVNFYATGGNGTYSWNTYDAQNNYGSGQNFNTRFNSVGSKNVTVTSDGRTATCYVNINAIYGNSTSFQITKNVLNKTLNQNVYVNSIEAQSGDLVEFEIRIRNTGNTSAEITAKDLLPSDLNYVYGSATVNNSYLNDSLVNYNGVSLGNVFPGEEKVIRLRATVRINAPAVMITNQAVGIMNSNTQNAFATIQLRNRGQVLGAADVVTGPEDVLPWALSLGLITSLIVYFYFFYSRPESKKVSFAIVNSEEKVESAAASKEEVGVFKAVKPQKELDSLISALKKSEIAPDS